MNPASVDLLIDAEDELNRQAHQEEVEEMAAARTCGEYDCGQDENDEECGDCHWDGCPKKLETGLVIKETVTHSKRRRDRRKRSNLKKATDKKSKPKVGHAKSTFEAPNYQAYLNFSRSRRPVLKADGQSVRDCNAIIFEEWHSMPLDTKIPFYNK